MDRFPRPRFSRLPLWLAAGMLFASAAPALRAQTSATYTSATSGTFTNPLLWNFGAGPVPASDPNLALTFQTFGTGVVNPINDLNLTLGTLNLNTYGTGGLSLGNLLNGNYAFAGAGAVNLLGSGAVNSLTAPVVLGSTASSLSFAGAGGSGITVSGVISSNASAPLVVAGTAGNAGTGVVTLSGANTFAGGVTLNSGTLGLNSNRALGDAANVLTVNGGNLRGNAGSVANAITLNATADFNLTSTLTLTGPLSGAGGVFYNSPSDGAGLNLRGVNTYAGPTTIGAQDYATGAAFVAGGVPVIRLTGAVGSILNTSAVNLNSGGILEINLTNGNSGVNPRVSLGTPIRLTGGFLQVIGNDFLNRQSFGTVTAGGLTTVLANTTGAATSVTELTIGNFVRPAGAAAVFSGPNLGNAAAAPGATTRQGNVLLTQINGVAPSAALVGGGGTAGATNISILPWALGDTATTGTNFNAGTGFVTYGANGVRLLDPTTEYNTSNNLAAAGPTDNVRIVAGAVTNPSASAAFNSLFFAASGQTVGGAGTITLTSGALASNVAAAAITAPLRFGAGGTGEAVVSVVSPVNSGGPSNTLTLGGGFTAGSLTKSGNGLLAITGATAPAIAGGIAIDGGQISVPAVSFLGGATGLSFNGQFAAANVGAALVYTGTGADALSLPVVVNSSIAGFVNAAGTLAINSNISGAGGVRFDGAGTRSLGGTNTYLGGTYFGGGTTQISSDARLGSAANPQRNYVGFAGGTLQLTGAWTSARNVTVDAGGALDTQANAATLSGAISGPGSLTKLGAGTLTITGANNPFTGTITLGDGANAGGTLALSGAGELNSGSVTFGANGGPAGTYTLDLSGATAGAAGGTPTRHFAALNTTGGFTQAHGILLGASAGAPVDLRVSAGTFSGAISGFGSLVKTGTGALTLGGTSAFTGGVDVRGGTLQIGADNQLGAAANAVTLRGGILTNTAPVTTNRGVTLGATPQPIISGSVVQTLVNGLNAGDVVVTNNFTLNGTLTGAGGFNKSGTGILTLGAAANTYAGDTQISAGALSFTNNAQLGAAGSRLRLNGGTLALNATPASATTTTLARTVIGTANSTFDAGAANNTLELSGPILAASGVSLTKIGAGQLTISGNNPSWFGTLIVGNGTNAGSVSLTGQMRRASVLLAGSAAATFDLGGLTRELGGLNTAAGDAVALGSGGALTFGFNNAASTLAGSITGNGAAAVAKTGTGTLAIQGGGSTFGGGLNLLSGAGDTTLSLAGALPLQSGVTLGAWGSTLNAGPRFVLDNTGTDLGTRLADAQAVYSNAGEFAFSSNAAAASSETAGSLRGAGQTTVTLTAGGTLAFADAASGLTRVNNGTFLFRNGAGTLGSGAASPTVGNLLFANLPGAQLIGGGGTAGTTTMSILPYAMGDILAAGAGSTFVTYGANGVRPLAFFEYNSQADAASLTAAAADNVRLTNANLTTTQLTGGADRTINALLLEGKTNGTRLESAGSERLVLTSGALLNSVANVYAVNAAGTAGVPLGIQVAELRTGAGNTRELNVFTPGDLAIGAKITDSGGLTKSGAGALFLTNPANTYTGATTVNAGNLVVDSLAALGGSATLQLGGGYLKYRGGDATLTQNVVAAGGSAADAIGGSAGFYIVSGTTLTVPAGGISGYGGVLKDGTGVLKLTGTNPNSGATLIAGGALAIDNPAALGTNGRVVFTDNGNSAGGGQTLRFDAPMTLTQDFVVNGVMTPVGFGFDTNGNNVTLSGTLLDARTSNARGLYKFGAGELNLTATEMFTGAAQVFGGSLRLSGANGSLLNAVGTGGFIGSSVFLDPGTSLVLDNAAANNNNRLPDVWDTPFGTGNGNGGKVTINGGELRLIGNAAGTSERINQLDVSLGTITLQGGGATLTAGRLNRPGATSAGLVRGTNLGAAPGAGSANLFLVDLGSGSTPLSGAGGAKGTPFLSIIPGFMGDASATGAGTDLLTYSSDVGVRLLTANEYAGAIPAGNFDLNRAPNVALTGAANVGRITAVNALKLGVGASVGGPGTLLLGSSTVLATGSAAIAVPSLSSNVSGSNSGYDFLTPGAATTLAVDSTLPSGALTKYGAGTLTLNGRMIGAGGVNVGQGTLRLGTAAAALNPLNDPVTILPGATFDLGGSDRIIAGLNVNNSIGVATVIGTFNLGQASDGTVALGANRLTLYDLAGSSFTGAITGTGGLTKAFFSSGLITFTQPLTYSGSTILRGGTLQLAGAGTLASTSGVELRGGNLTFYNADDNAAAGGYAANRLGAGTPITLASGAITFTDNANAPGSHALGPITLTGGGALTVSSGANAPSAVTIANLIRPAGGGALTIAAGNLGLAPSSTRSARVLLTQINGAAPASALLGGGGAVGTTTQSILPWGYSSTAESFLTYGADGLRPLAAGEYAASLTGAGANDNVRTTAATTLTAATTVNSLLNTNGGVSGAFDLTLNSGALTNTILGATVGVNTNALLTGAGNTRELVINNTAAATLAYNVSTTGGVTKFGSGALILAGSANLFAGGLTVAGGAVAFTSDAQLGAAGGPVRLAGGGLTYTGAAALNFTRLITVESNGTLAGAASQRWTLNQPISGSGGVTFATSNAVFDLAAANAYTGPTVITGGQVYINGDSAFGNGGELVLSASATQNIVLRGDWTTGRLIQAASGGAIQTNGFDAAWNGLFAGTGSFAKNGCGSLILTAAMSHNGTINVNAGSLVLRDGGSLAASGASSGVNAGAALTLDDTGSHHSDRVNDTSGSFTLTGGAFNLLGNGAVPTEEVISSLSLNNGASTINIVPGAGQSAVLRLTNSPGVATSGGSLWRGLNLGVNAPGTADSANILLIPTNAQAQAGLPGLTFLTGGGGPAGNPSISIIRGAFGDTTADGLGTQLVTYDLANGVRLLDPVTEYTATLANGTIVIDNVKVDGSTLTLANATTANALWLKDGGSVTGANNLMLTAGALLITGTGNVVDKPLVASGALVVGGPGDVTFTAAIPSAQNNGLIKLGAGTLTLSVANAYTGATILDEGTVAVGNAAAFNTSAVQFQGGTLTNGAAGPLALANNLTLNGAMRVDGAQPLTFSGTVSLNNATRRVIVMDPAGAVTFSGAVSSSQTLINYGLTKAGPGRLVLANNNPFDGPALVRAGTLEANAAGALGAAASLTVNAGGTLLLSGAAGVTTRLNDAAPVFLAGGTLNTGGLSEGSAAAVGVGALTLSASSSFDFGAGASVFHFADSSASAWTNGATLTLLNWSGSASGGGTDQLLFGASASALTAAQLGQIQFDLGGGSFASANILANGEIVPGAAVPEPATWVGGAGLAGLLVWSLRRRFAGKGAKA